MSWIIFINALSSRNYIKEKEILKQEVRQTRSSKGK